MREAPSTGWYWLSFACDAGFLGAAVIGPVQDFEAAQSLARYSMCHPGGEVEGFLLYPEQAKAIPAGLRFKVLTWEQAQGLDARFDKLPNQQDMGAGGQWWWLSYADEDGLLGVLIIGPVSGFMEAVQKAKQRGLSPGGQVKGTFMPAERVAETPASYRHRLLSEADCHELTDVADW